MKWSVGFLFPPLLLGAAAPLYAADAEPGYDAIIVTASPTEQRVLPDQLVLDSEAIDEIQPLVIADIVRGVAGVSLRQNSRGETVVRIRSGEERQTPIFLDGAPLATPWDGRIDLGILPSGIVRHVAVTRSAAPIEYGANAIAGVVDLRSATPDQAELLQAELRTGSGQLFNVAGLADLGLGQDTALTLAGTYRKSDYQTVAKRSAIPFDPSRGDRRSNTDQRSTSLFAAIGHEGEAAHIRASLLHADAVRGIAAEGHIDPALDRPRYWRYPLWRLTQATLNADAELGDVQLRSVVWHQWFAQNIDSYSDSSYAALEEREQGRDQTIGGRLTLSGPVGTLQWRLSASALSSTHRQTDFEVSPGAGSNLTETKDLRFRQQFLSAGAELDIELAQYWDLTLGAGIDASFTPLTGDKPHQPSARAPGLSAILRWQPADDLVLKASLARRTRFATLREQFGQALGRFLPNPGLQPEKATSAELAAAWRLSDMVSAEAEVWLNDSRDTLGQRIATVDGRKLRQRYNMRGALTYGLEASVNLRLSEQLTGELSAAYQAGEPRAEPGNLRPKLVQQVNFQMAAALDWRPVPGLDLRSEYRHYGRAFDLDEAGAYVRLPTANIVNLRGFWTLRELANGGSVLLSLSAENVTDELILPQLGLPAPGRSFVIGLKLKFGR